MKNNKLKLYTGYIIIFDQPDNNNIIYTKQSIDLNLFENMKISGNIINYIIDDIGVKITKNYDF